MLSRRQMIAATAFGALAFGGVVPRALAQATDKLVHMIVGFPAGGGTDVTARVLAEALHGAYASTVLVENKPGASARLAVEYVKNADARRQRHAVHAGLSDDALPAQLQVAELRSVDRISPRSAPATTSMLSYNVGPAVPASVKTLADYRAVVQGQPGQGELRHHLGRRHAALRRRHAGERGRRCR